MDSKASERSALQEIIDNALLDMRREAGGELDLEHVNLADFCRRTGLSRSKARTIRSHGFRALPHGRTGQKASRTVMSGHEDVADSLLRKGVTNSAVILERLRGDGYVGGLTTVKEYIRAHMDLVPPKAKAPAHAPQGTGMRYSTAPGECFQMDWGFVDVDEGDGTSWRAACFCMVCHHCGTSYAELFPNARQECLLIGMGHAFMCMGIPDFVLTDNMKSVVTRRDADGRPVWQHDYAAFMECIGFGTRLCRPRHPFTKGKVERLVRYVKENFLAGRTFADFTQLNEEALLWCRRTGAEWHRATDMVPADEHAGACMAHLRTLPHSEEVDRYLCPLRRVSFDRFVSYEGRRFGVPWWYGGRRVRVSREGRLLHIYSEDLSRELAVHPVTWSRKDSCCEGQFRQPEELPTQPVTTTIERVAPAAEDSAFGRFAFGRRAR